MDYLGLQCPVCGKIFHDNDDIVVCPECGAPHHRECYEKENKCHFESKHKDGFVYENEQEKAEQETIPDGIICPHCKTVNSKDLFFCRKCGNPIQKDGFNPQQGNNANGQGAPYGDMNGMTFVYDPMGGIGSEEDLGDGVTAGEAAKFVKNNTPYFLRIFKNIKTFSKSRFNFSAFLFGGGYFLYRKMYGIGTILTVIMAVLLIVPIFLSMTPAYYHVFQNLMSLAGISTISSYADIVAMANAGVNLPFDQLMIFCLPAFCEILRYVLMICCGLCANRQYYKHCVKKISTAKKTVKTDAQKESFYNSKGGVNTALGISLMVAYIIIIYLPNFMSMFNLI